MDLDLALREKQSAALHKDSPIEEKSKYEKWMKANRMCLLIMQRFMLDAIRGGNPEYESAKRLLDAIGKKLVLCYHFIST